MGNTLIGVRFLAPIFLALSSILIYRLTLEMFHDRKNAKLTACAAALIFQLTPLFAAFGIVMTIDSPFVFFWTLSLYLLWKALQNRESTLNWVLLGISVGMGLLTKYTMAFFLLSTFLLFIFSKEERIHFRKKGPYIALLVSLLDFSPVLIWNAGHEWATFKHTAGQTHIAEGIRISFKDFFEFVGSQIGVLSPLLFFMLFYGAIKSMRFPESSRGRNLVFWFWFPVIAFFLLKSLQGKVQANWAMPAYITLFIAGPAYFLRTGEIKKRVKGLILAALLILLAFSLITHYPSIINIPVKQDPTSRLMGWEELGKKADALYSDMRSPEGKDVFIFSDKYQVASELAFYMESHPVTYNINLGRRMNQYDMWKGFEDLIGFDAIFVRTGNKRLPSELKNAFDSYSKEVLPVYRRDNKVLREYSIFKCYNFKGIEKRGFDSY
jgi:undecaprenyl-diphosphatase